MTMNEFLLVWGICLATMLICRCVPIFVLKERQLPEKVTNALNLIPPAAFAALVANDLLGPNMFNAGIWPGLLPLIAAAVVVFVAKQTHSLIWCAISGVLAYSLLLLI